MLRTLIAWKLRLLSVAVLAKYKPIIVAVTGSVGKSSTKEAIFEILQTAYSVRINKANYNTEIGVPLTILGSDAPGRNIFKWKLVFLKALALILFKKPYPQVLVLEMGADRPGDLEYLTSFVKPNISVVMSVGISHLEFFKTREAIAREKGALLRALSESGLAVLNADDEMALGLKSQTKGRVLAYGFSSSADFRAENVRLTADGGRFKSQNFDLINGDNRVSIELEHGFGDPIICALLAASIVGRELNIALTETARVSRNFTGLTGRLRLIEGSGGSMIIDDSYNSAPASAIAALKVLREFPGKRKIAVLGRMVELGEAEKEGHRSVGKRAAELGIDLLLIKNNQALMIADGAAESGFSDNKIIKFSNADEAIRILRDKIEPGDVVLIKASQADYFEDIIKGIMKNPVSDKYLLVDRDYTRKI